MSTRLPTTRIHGKGSTTPLGMGICGGSTKPMDFSFSSTRLIGDLLRKKSDCGSACTTIASPKRSTPRYAKEAYEHRQRTRQHGREKHRVRQGLVRKAARRRRLAAHGVAGRMAITGRGWF